jgi:hypothetical protein
MFLPSTKYLYLRWQFIFLDKTQLDQLPLSVFQLNCEEGREIKWFNAIAGGEGPILYVL